MHFLKWLLKAGFILALMFLGLSAQPKHNDSNEGTAHKAATHLSIFK